MLIEGQRLGDFEILDHIGQGGMGAVFKARQISLERIVALKTLKPFVSDDPEYVARFHQEAVAAAALKHPNLVKVYAAGEAEGLHYFAMEYIEGESALARLEREGRVEPLEAIAIASHIAAALEYGWRKAGLIHRDIKPDNIFLSTEGEVKLGDLGLAKRGGQSMATQTGASIGTPDYMSPEQAEGKKDIDLRADIYSLGCALYHLLSGQTPYVAESAMAVMLKHVSAPVPDLREAWPECPAELAALVSRMMQKAPADRPQSHAEVCVELQRVYDVMTGTSVPNTIGVAPWSVGGRRGTPSLPAAQKSKLAFYAGIGGGIIALAAAAFFFFQPKPQSPIGASALSEGRAPARPQSPPGAPAGSDGRAGAHPSDVTKDAPYENTLGMKFVPVPIIGGPTGGQRVLFSVWDTRVQDYAAFAKEKQLAWPKPDFEQAPTHPAVMVLWEEAQLFCQWLTSREQAKGRLPAGYVYRLPSDHEWSCAVELGAREDAAKLPVEKSGKIGDTFPWGSAWPPPANAGNYAGEEVKPLVEAGKYGFVKSVIAGYHDAYVYTSPVGSFAANRFGLFDLGGNVWQYCADWFDNDRKDHVRRGASWGHQDRGHLLSSFRERASPTSRSVDVGFRCVLGPPLPVSAASADRLAGGTPAPHPPAAKPTTPLPVAAATPKPPTEVEKWFAQVDGPQQDAFQQQAVKPFQTGLTNLRARYLASLDASLAKASAASRLADALAFRTEKQAFEKAQNVASDDGGVPDSLKAMRVGFRQQLALLDQERTGRARTLLAPYDAILAKYQTLLTQRQRLDDALLLKTKRDEIARAWLAPSPLLTGALSDSAEAAPPIPAPEASVTTATGPVSGKWEDLFTPLTPAIVEQTGHGWRLEGGALSSPNTKRAVVPLPGNFSGASYQVHVTLRQFTPKESISLHLPVADQMVLFTLDGFPMDGYYTGLNMVDGLNGKKLPGAVAGQQVNDAEPHELEVTVRLDGVNARITATLDTHPLYEWAGPAASLSRASAWAITEPGVLALGTMADGWAVSAVKVKRLVGK